MWTSHQARDIYKIIRILHEFEVLIEKSVIRVKVLLPGTAE